MTLIAGKYETLKELGRGGSGVVYLVKHVDLNIEYALKVLNPSFLSSPETIERFKHEAGLLQSFTHKGTAQLRDFGRTDEGAYYIAMDYCQGLSLRDVLDQDGPFPLNKAFDLMVQVLDVLEAAHHEDIIHRDIQPANMIINSDSKGKELVKILDFGTAILKERIDPTNSEDHVTIGTPCYMSPQQASGSSDIDHRSDIYSAGIVMYELLTGEVPFEGENVVQTLVMHITQPPLSFAYRYSMPEYVEELVFKALAKKPEDRYSSAAEFKAACLDVQARFRSEVYAIDPPQKSEVPKKKVVESKAERGTKQRILCLDDDEMILNIMKHILEAAGYQVFTALDCSAIHDYLFKEKVDLLVSDIQMPDMPGPKVVKLIKSSLPELKVVFFSNLPERDIEKLAKENGVPAWISKNKKPEEWLAAINEILAED